VVEFAELSGARPGAHDRLLLLSAPREMSVALARPEIAMGGWRKVTVGRGVRAASRAAIPLLRYR
jgi:hypothetical protein